MKDIVDESDGPARSLDEIFPAATISLLSPTLLQSPTKEWKIKSQ